MTQETDKDKQLLQWHPEYIKMFRELIGKGKPYVWELRLSLDDFTQLEGAIQNSIASHGGDHRHLLSGEYALFTVIYLAEWYKRFYTGNDGDNPVINLSTEERKNLWKSSGININTFVYDASTVEDKTSMRWRESLQVLGGLAVKAELRRDEDDPILGKLCRIYHGENVDLSEVRDYQRAVAFRESIARQHSLYDYLAAVLSDNPPFSKSDLDDSKSDFSKLISRIKDADREVRRDKFAFEWRVTYSTQHSRMVRSLAIKLRPEEVGGKYKEYIRYDRLRNLWDIDNPEEIERLRFDLRIKNGSKIIREADFSNSILIYTNTGSSFIATKPQSVAEDGEVVFTEVPTELFTKVSIIMKYGNETRKVQDIDCEGFLQVYKRPQADNVWISRRLPQVATAVIFSDKYRLMDDTLRDSVVRLPFAHKDKVGETMNWCPIYDTVTLLNDHDKEYSFFNRNGRYQVVAKRYLDTIKYLDDLYALYKYVELDEDDDVDEQYDDDDFIQEQLPVLFGREGLEVRYFPHKDAKDWTPVENYDLEFKVSGRYTAWTPDNEPQQGKRWLRITVKDMSFVYKVYYVPFIDTPEHHKPISRDLSNMRILTNIPGVDSIIQDSFTTDLEHQESDTKTITLGNNTHKLLLDIYRPVKLTELYQNDKLINYYGSGNTIHLPLLTVNQFAIRDFSEKGVEKYSCGELRKGIYRFKKLEGNNINEKLYYQHNTAASLNSDIPLENVVVNLFTDKEKESIDLYAWDYEQEPYKVKSFSDDNPGIIFQSLKDNPSPRNYIKPQEKDNDDEGWGDDDDEDSVTATPLQAFKVAMQHHTYFFIFDSLRIMAGNKRMVSDLLVPILRKSEGQLDDETVSELYRLAYEFHFDWMLLDRYKYLSAIENEDDKEHLKAGIIDFFSRTPKCTSMDEHTSLDDFLTRYWMFTRYTATDKIGVTALKLILGDPEALGRNGDMDKLLEAYDNCRYKFSEMSKTI